MYSLSLWCLATWISWINYICHFARAIDITSMTYNETMHSSLTCKLINKNSLSFCTMVNYYAVVDKNDETGANADIQARIYYNNIDLLLLRFGCKTKYSLYTCEDCREAYQYWICATLFQKCGENTDGSLNHRLCGRYSIAAGKFQNYDDIQTDYEDISCHEGSSGRYRTCLSLCEDVVRKCPYVIEFQCPMTNTEYFSSNITNCNKLDRQTHPDRPSKPWPGSFVDE